MEASIDEPQALVIKDCALLAIATGKQAQDLRELRDHILTIHPDSLYFHFWGGLLHPRFEEREYNNDFAAWARHQLHDKILAERLSVVDPAAYADLEELREELVEIIEQRLDEREMLASVSADQGFEFIRAQIVVFRTDRRFRRPEELAENVGKLAIGSVFYHFIDARRRNDNRVDDFRNWLDSFQGRYEPVSRALSQIDPYFTSLTGVRARLAEVFSQCLGVAHG
ncbi:DUF5752 family protein [Candidatus Methylocalor cossyra]|uniref:Uncharacterized protein n=1 Tax=Candidatus Methylocalor cossyra TaxID=3108543 RepID=A0ABP1C5T4_9GAMM